MGQNTGKLLYLNRKRVFVDCRDTSILLEDTGITELNTEFLNDGVTPDPNYIEPTWETTTCPIPIPPRAPANVAASDIGATSFVLSWSASIGASGYKVFKDGSLAYNSITTTSKVITGLTPSTTSYWSVKAYNNSGDSPFSNSIGVSLPDTVYPILLRDSGSTLVCVGTATPGTTYYTDTNVNPGYLVLGANVYQDSGGGILLNGGDRWFWNTGDPILQYKINTDGSVTDVRTCKIF